MNVLLHTFGCKANQYDTELVRQSLTDAGASVVEEPSLADFAVINSCAVTHTSEAKMRSFVRRLNRINPQLRTVIMGCAAAIDDGKLAKLKGVESVVGGSDPRAVLEALGLDNTVDDTVLRSFARGSRAWVKVQDGCDEHCTFCATTVARGASRSRSIAEITEEVKLLGQAHSEIVITGIHIGSYGLDLRSPETLGSLLETLVKEFPNIRFRLSSVEATELDERLQDLMAAGPRCLAPHVHAPLQSGSDRILRLMGRHWYDSSSYRKRIEHLAARLPAFGLGADVMVGFPGETDIDHRATLDLIRELPFTYLHVFPYSERSVASAKRLGPPVVPALAAARSAELRDLVKEKKRKYSARRSGEITDVVLTSRRNGVMEGITGDYLTVVVAGNPGSQRFDAELEWTDGTLHARVAL